MNKSQRFSRTYLFITAFFAGMTSLAVEFAASRLLGNVFGTSNLVWASIIGLILIYLTVGYWLGGKLADRSPNAKTLFVVLLWAGFCIGLVPLISRPVLSFSSDAFDQLNLPGLFGSFSVVVILFSVPVTLLGVASPFVIKLLLKDPERTGSVAGKVSAISTLGSFLGTFVTVLVMIPLMGTYRTFILLSLVMLAISFVGLLVTGSRKVAWVYLWMPVVIIILAFIGLRGTDKNSPGLVYETESAYNYIQVLESGDYIFLRINEGQGVHSIYHPTELFYAGPWSQALVPPLFNPSFSPDQVNRIAILGLAAGTTARQASVVYPQAVVDGFEIDPKIIDVGNRYFGMELSNLNTFTEDARWGLAHSEHLYDIISVDAYKPPYIPAHMTTVEFFAEVKAHLRDDGLMVINVGRSPLDRVIVDSLASTISEVFPKVFISDIPNSFNTVIFASTSSQASWQNLEINLVAHSAEDLPALLQQAATITLAGRVDEFERIPIFTDDRAPIEWLTNKIVLDYVFSDEAGDLE